MDISNERVVIKKAEVYGPRCWISFEIVKMFWDNEIKAGFNEIALIYPRADVTFKKGNAFYQRTYYDKSSVEGILRDLQMPEGQSKLARLLGKV